MSKCLELDPELRFSASEAMNHEWIKDSLMKRESTTSLAAVNRSLAIS
jgi:serine/threonine protein kinase